MTGAELAAVAAALSAISDGAPEPEEPRHPAWKTAMRHPDLGIDEVRALHKSNSCSPKF